MIKSLIKIEHPVKEITNKLFVYCPKNCFIMYVVDIHEFEKMHIKSICQLSPGNEEALELLNHTFIK